MEHGLNPFEAINRDGTAAEVENALSSVPRRQKVMSYGDDNLVKGFAGPKKGEKTCYEKKWYTCTELRQAKASGNFGKVFGWTVSAIGSGPLQTAQSALVKFLFDDADVDGVIYGFRSEIYKNSGDTRAALKSVFDWINAYSQTVKVADSGDPSPWS